MRKNEYRKLRIAGLTVGVSSRYGLEGWVCGGHETAEPADFSVQASDEEISREMEQFGSDSRELAEMNLLYRKVCLAMLPRDGFLLHAAVVAMDGEAYAFTAPSGTGKSTHARYWLEAFGGRACILNGDKPILRILDGAFFACGTPWRGKERLGVAENLPLKAVCLLERGPENEIAPATVDEVLEKVFRQILMPQDREQAEKQLDLIDRLAEQVPVYRLKCNMSVDAARVAYEGMR